MKLVFFGTPEFSLSTLKLLHNSNHQISYVVTTPDKKSGRGMTLNSSPVKILANKLNISMVLTKERHFYH